MKNTENNKNLYRRYLDDLYTTEDAREILNSLHHPDNHETLDELSSDVWEEAATQQPLTDLEREHYKREARQLLNKPHVAFSRKSVVLRTPMMALDEEKPEASPPPFEF